MAGTRPIYQSPDLIITDFAAATYLTTRHRPLFTYAGRDGTMVFHFPVDAASTLAEWNRARDFLRAELQRDRDRGETRRRRRAPQPL